MDLHLTDRVILVSGGAKGIGAAICRVLAAEGAVPVVIGRNRADNERLVAEIDGVRRPGLRGHRGADRAPTNAARPSSSRGRSSAGSTAW